MNKLGALLLACLTLPARSQDGPYYYDYIATARQASSSGNYELSLTSYRLAFARRAPLAHHALECARICWLLNDTASTTTHASRALSLGITGDALQTDSVLATYWRLPSAQQCHSVWGLYEAMQLPALKAEPEAMFEQDQTVRRSIDNEKAYSPDSLVRRSVWAPIEAMDRQHAQRVAEIIDAHGVPNVHQVGLTGNKMIFFAFIHGADDALIKRYIRRLSDSVKNGGSPPTWYAYLIDRVMSRTTLETMFGTTGYVDRSDGTTYFMSVVPSATDELRETMGLPRMGQMPD